jgi:hypothetical protein
MFQQLDGTNIMPITAEQMYGQITKAVEALSKMSAKERGQNPTKQFAENYNTQLALSKEALPNVDNRRWPPIMEIHTPSAGQPSAKGKYIEFHTYYSQMQSILAEGLEPAPYGFVA